MTIQAHYKTKKELKASIGQELQYTETSMFGKQFLPNGKFCVADSSLQRKWFAEVTMVDGKIAKVT